MLLKSVYCSFDGAERLFYRTTGTGISSQSFFKNLFDRSWVVFCAFLVGLCDRRLRF